MSTVAPDPTYTTPGWTYQANGSENVTAGAGTSSAVPNVNGLIASTLPLDTLSYGTAVAAASGVGYAGKIQVAGAANTGKFGYVAGAAATSPTHGGAALFDMAGNLKATTGDLTTTAFLTVTGFNTINWTAPVTLSSGFYYLFMFYAGSALTLFGSNVKNAALNANTATSTLRFATNGSSLVAMPSTLVVASNAADSTVQPFMAIL